MIVISLIAVIGGVLSYNLKGALEKGKAFKTEQAQKQIIDAFELICSEENVTPQTVINNSLTYLQASQLIKNPDRIILDGWGEEMKLDYKNGKFVVFSENLKRYKAKQEALKKIVSQ